MKMKTLLDCKMNNYEDENEDDYWMNEDER